VPLPSDLPVVDHHCHLSPNGEGVRAAERFRAAGGTHLFLATQNHSASVPRALPDYAEQFETTLRLATRVHEETGVVVAPVVAPYPIDLIGCAAAIGLGAAVELQHHALDLAGRIVREQRAVAIGEVGLAHFPVPAEIAQAMDSVFRRALEVARDAGCPAIVHASDLDAGGLADLAERGRAVGLAPERIVKHYQRSHAPSPAPVAVSYLARRELVREVLADEGAWFLETDFLDDPARPGAVLDLATVPRRAQALAERGSEGAEPLYRPFVESIERVYGFRPEVPPGVRR
jgi:TatD-related deoxyribonuclease